MTGGTAAVDTRARLLATALRLFSRHGVQGTSLQMIADELGLTKAAVYYYFKTKDEITEAVAAPALQEMEKILDEAATRRVHAARVDHALAGFVDIVVRHRSLVALFNCDPGIVRAIERMAGGSENFKIRLMRLLAGSQPDLAAGITVRAVLAGLALVGGSQEYQDIDADTLRTHLFDVGRRMLGRLPHQP